MRYLSFSSLFTNFRINCIVPILSSFRHSYMYGNDGAVLGAATVTAPTILGTLIWPDLALILAGGSFVLLGLLYLAFKRRARRV
jgi:hypothetical protein